MKLVALAVLATACSQHVYSPPTQAYNLGGIRSLDPGQRALDLEVSRHQQIFDPGVVAGSGRLRTGIGDNTEISVEGAAMAVESNGASQAPGQIYTGRIGVRTNPSKSAFAFFGGAGGGWSPAGGDFVAADGGVAVGYHNCTLVPLAQASAFFSAPLDARPIDVTEADDHGTVTSTPTRTFGTVVRGGLRLSLSPSACRAGRPVPWLTAGFDVTTLVDAKSHADLGGVGLGIEIPL